MGLYVQMHSMHGLFRSENLELGRDEDTGGQIVYVLELARALSKLKEVDRVDIFTRRIVDDDYPGYSDIIEQFAPKARIVRIECGPKKYIMKVDLWPYINEFIANCKKFIAKDGKPDILHSNYADSGYVCSKLSQDLNIPQVHTGHSLGIPKMQKLGVNEKNKQHFEKIYHFSKRIKAETEAITNSSAIIASTNEEIKHQYKGYKTNKKKFRNIAPGLDIERFHPKNVSDNEEHTWQILENCIMQGLKHPERVPVAVLTRLDKRKNLIGLIKAFAVDRELQRLANLLIFAKTLDGNDETQPIIDSINRMMRKYNLYDNVCLPGINLDYHSQVPAFYRFLAANNGIFVNPALIEPFGLTVIEAAACGVPVIATKNGGPSEIITEGKDGLLINPRDPKDMASKIKKLVRGKKLYNTISKNGIKNVVDNYTWDASAKKYLGVFREVINASGN